MTTTATAVSDRVSLYFKSGSSDKVYLASIEPLGAGYVVNFSYGRRGSTLTTGTKTDSPVGYATARKVFDQLVESKTKKGYSPGDEGTPYQHTTREVRSTGILPQLLNPISEADAHLLLNDPWWWAQPKIDGRRVLILKVEGAISGINRTGLVIALPQPIVKDAERIGGPQAQWLMDGEAVGDAYTAFDLLQQGHVDLREERYSTRLRFLYELVPGRARKGGTGIRAIETALGHAHKRAMLKQLRQENQEGIVFKRHDAPYTPGRPASGGDQRKLKFLSTASVLVAGRNGTKRSVALELFDAPGSATKVGVGNVTIPANHRELPPVGAVVEVRYLTAHRGGSLIQPVYLGIRDDILPGDCVLSQLKLKPEIDSEEDGEA